MRVVVIGQSGQLALSLAETVPAGVELVCLGHSGLDIASPAITFDVLTAHKPDILINASAYTAVDKAEKDPETAFALNARGPARLAEYAAECGIPLIHISTDYVFDGTASRPYVEDDTPAPLNVYGHSKLEGERAIASVLPNHIIVRTSWLFSAYGSNFVKTMLSRGREVENLRIVADQRGRPTSARELARIIWVIADRIAERAGTASLWGIYHYADAGEASWADIAEAIFASPEARLERAPQIQRITTDDYPTPARRPRYSVLDSTKIESVFNIRPRPWTASLRDVLQKIR